MPTFAYAPAAPDEYYLYAPIDYQASKIKSAYKVIPPHQKLVTELDNYPSESSLIEIQIDLGISGILNGIDIVASGIPGGWTTHRNPSLWGVGIADSPLLRKVVNTGNRSDELNLKVSNSLTLLVPGALPGCPDLFVDMWFKDKGHLVTSASCK